MKILLVSESYWPNADGGALFERRLVQGLEKAGHSVSVWAPGKYRHSYIEKDGSYTIYREKSLTLLINRKYRASFWPWRSASKIMKAIKPDIIHLHNAGLMGIATLAWAKHYKIPVVATNHFMPENWVLNVRFPGKRRFSKWLIWKYLAWFHNRCDFVTSPTPTAVELLRTAGLRAPSRAISNGVDTTLFAPHPPLHKIAKKYGISTQNPVVLYLGRVDGEKRIDIIISAFQRLLLNKDVQLVIAGFGKAEPALKALVNKLNVQESVVFTGFIDESDKPGIYNLANVFVIASPAELQSIVLLEAMASGLPVVAVNVAALSELCHDGQNGYLFEHENASQLADKLGKILGQSGIEKRFGAESRKIVLKNHSNQSTLKNYESVYIDVLKRKQTQ